MLKTGDTFDRKGKTFKFIGIELNVDECKIICDELAPEFITPTDEHAKQRPACEVRDYDDQEWQERGTLIHVRAGNSFKFLSDSLEYGFSTWKQCRIRNPELKQ